MEIFEYTITHGAMSHEFGYYAAKNKKEVADYLTDKVFKNNPEAGSVDIKYSPIEIDNIDDIDIVKKEEYDQDFKTWIKNQIELETDDPDIKKAGIKLGFYKKEKLSGIHWIDELFEKGKERLKAKKNTLDSCFPEPPKVIVDDGYPFECWIAKEFESEVYPKKLFYLVEKLGIDPADITHLTPIKIADKVKDAMKERDFATLTIRTDEEELEKMFRTIEVKENYYYHNGKDAWDLIDEVQAYLEEGIDNIEAGYVYNILKYLLRYPYKDNAQKDLNKAIDYIARLKNYINEE